MGGDDPVRAFILSLVAVVIIAIGAHFALGSLQWGADRVYSNPASVRLQGPV
jgi:hypothetical protein